MDSGLVQSNAYGDKTQRVLAAIRIGGMTAAEIASSTKVSIPLVYQVARAQGIKIKSGRARAAPHPRGVAPLKRPELFVSNALVEIVSPPLQPAPHREHGENKEARLRLMLAKQLEEILERQRRIWGDLP